MSRTSERKSILQQGSLFEEDYLLRSLGVLAYSPEVALTELVANAWDAGATNVNITIPDDYGGKLMIEDNGTGLSKDQFLNRWMKLGYNRLKHQGKYVVFPDGIDANRFAYGRNGVGRHGLLCFNNEYKVITSAQGERCTFLISTLSETQPFVIKDYSSAKDKKHGTRLEVSVSRNLPMQDRILEVISARFLHDPNFIVSMNQRTVHLEEFTGLIDSRELNVNEEICIQVHFIDSQMSSRSTLYQGIAFWQGGRLVGEPSWILGREFVVDGRTKNAKRYKVVVKSDDLSEYILEDWTDFKKTETMKAVYQKVGEYVLEMFNIVDKENVEDVRQQIKNQFAEEIADLSALGKFEVNETIVSLTSAHPTAKQETINIAIEAVINLEKTRSGKDLLFKLSKLSDNDIEGLNRLLNDWSLKDALIVLDEIDNRIKVIEAIRKLSKDKSIDELHTLHPLVTSARWLFGPEYDSSEYVSNRQLQNAVEIIFKTKVKKDVFANHKKRPDIVALQDATLSITGTENFDNGSALSSLTKILLIELKKGGFKLSRKDRDQATGYVEDFMSCGAIIGNPFIDAFVVGAQFSEKVQPITTVANDSKIEMGKVRICTFAQLVDTAEKRLFGLRSKLNERYDDIPGLALLQHKGKQLEAELFSTEKN